MPIVFVSAHEDAIVAGECTPRRRDRIPEEAVRQQHTARRTDIDATQIASWLEELMHATIDNRHIPATIRPVPLDSFADARYRMASLGQAPRFEESVGENRSCQCDQRDAY